MTKRMKTIAILQNLKVSLWKVFGNSRPIIHLLRCLFSFFYSHCPNITSDVLSIIRLIMGTSLPPFAFGDRLQSFGPILYIFYTYDPCHVTLQCSLLWANDLLSLLTLSSVIWFTLSIGCLGNVMQVNAWNGLVHWSLFFCQEKNDRIWAPPNSQWINPVKTSRATQINPREKSWTL